jgi:hypothetical protein
LLLPFHLDAQCSLFSSFLCSLRGFFLTVQKRFSSCFRRGNLFRGSNGGGLSNIERSVSSDSQASQPKER